MLRSGIVAVAVLMFAWLPGCGPPAGAATPSNPSGEPEAKGDPAAAGSGEASAEGAPSTTPEAGKGEKAEAASGESSSEGATLGRDFLKSGGRRIGYSATKKMFAYPLETRRATGFSLDIKFLGEDGNQHDLMRVCQFGECEEHLNEIGKTFLPKLVSRLEGDGYVSIRGIGWPDGRDELEVNSLSGKLHYSKGKMELSRDGKTAGLAAIGKRVDAKSPLAVFVVPDKKLLAVFALPGGGGGVVQDLYLVKLP